VERGEGGWIIRASISINTVGERRNAGSSSIAQEEEEEAGLPSLCMKINRVQEP